MNQVCYNAIMRIIDGFPNYQVEKNGTIHSKNLKAPKATVDNGNGYLKVNLWRDNKGSHRYIHRLVAQAYVKNPDSKPEVNHKDGDKSNNNSDNLEWVTRAENIKHSFDIGIRQSPKGNPKLDLKQVEQILGLRGQYAYQEIADMFGVKYSTVAHIMRGSRWQKALGEHAIQS